MAERRSFFRSLVLVAVAGLAFAGCASRPAVDETPPIVFVHGNGDTAALWTTTIWRFESNGWPRERLVAIDLPYPLSRDDNAKAQPGRTSTDEYRDFLKAEVDKVLARTGAGKVVLMSNSRGGYAIRDYIRNAGGDRTVSHAILGGAPNHGVWAIKGFRESNEFAGTGPFLTGLNTPRNAAGDEVDAPVRWLTIRSDGNDKFAQPDGVWIGARGTATNVTAAGPELRGATNVVIAGIDHRETSFSPAAFEAAYAFITGRASKSMAIQPEAQIVLNGKVTGLGVSSTDPKSGNFSNNLPLPGAQLTVYETDAGTGARRGQAVHSKTVGADGLWGPFTARPGVPYEFVLSAPGYAVTHIYRSAFPRGSNVVHLRPERVAEADRDAKALVLMTRPRGYFDPARDRMSFDGQTPPPGVPPGAGVASSKLKLAQARPVTAEFNGERITGLSWITGEPSVSVLELTY